MAIHHTFQLQSIAEQWLALIQQILHQAREMGYEGRDIFGMHITLEEALKNADLHGNKNIPDKRISGEYCLTESELTITITDEGDGFSLAEVPDPTLPENLEQPNGRGVLLMNTYATVKYNETGNSLTLVIEKTVSQQPVPA